METELRGSIWQVTSNPYDFEADNGKRMVGTAHHVYVLDFGDGKTPDNRGSERTFADVRLSDEQMEALRPAKDDDVSWRCTVKPNGNKLRLDLVAPVAVIQSAAKAS